MPDGTEAVIVELGANDVLRGIDPAVTKSALDKILSKLGDRHIAVLLAGMQAPRNMGPDYAKPSTPSIRRLPRLIRSSFIRSSSTGWPTIPS